MKTMFDVNDNKQARRQVSSLLRSRERGLLLLMTILLLTGFGILYTNINAGFADIEPTYKQGRIIKLSGSTDKQKLADVLLHGNYISSEADAGFIAGFMVDKLQQKKQLDNLGELNKGDFWIPAAQIDRSDAQGLKDRLNMVRGKALKIRLFERITYQQLKRNSTLIVRTPEEFRSGYFRWMLIFFAVFWFIHIFWSIRRYTGDFMILPVVMLLCGINVVMMYAIPDPLTDTIRGVQMSKGVVWGAVILFFLSFANIQKIYASPNFNIPFFGSRLRKLHENGKLDWLPGNWDFLQKAYRQRGVLYILLAFGLALWLAFAGHGPDGSDGVKVNIKLAGLSFEPAEITKYLMVIFFATYFNRNSEYLREMPSLKWRLLNSWSVSLLFAGLLLIYLSLGDMGPALVLCGTFLTFYAVARGELKEMILGVLCYTLALAAAYRLTGAQSSLPALLITLLYFAFWILYGLLRKKWHESSFLIVFVIAAFVFGGLLSSVTWFGPAAEVGKRLNQRNDMFLHVWDNETYGGDQVAHGIWSLASGGLTGQGLGKGDPKMMPASHTDMILASLGEETGLLGMLAVFIAIGLLLSRCLGIARKTGNPLLFYLAGGIAVVTGIQFLVIAAGSIGALPLTGVSVPFLSYGRIGMLAQMAAFGIVLAISSRPGSDIQTAHIHKHYNKIIRLGQWSFSCALLILFGCFLVPYMLVNRDEYLIRPAFAVDRNGGRTMIYNPRIELLMDHLSAGNIYDRNGLILATGTKDSVLKQEAALNAAGIPDAAMTRLKASWQQRYYPFGNHLFFWTGDYNSRLLWGNMRNGYLAENRHLSFLRGFDTQHGQEIDTVIAKNYRKDKLSPARDSQFVFSLNNYSALLPMLKAGKTSKLVKNFKKKDRSIQLTVDAALQMALQNAMQADSGIRSTRNGIIVLNPANGEVLASAVNPLPDMSLLTTLYGMSRDSQQRAINTGKINGRNFVDADIATSNPTAPGSTAKIITALAAMNKKGLDAAHNEKYDISCGEIVDLRLGEPCGHYVKMDEAITGSSNVFFARIANELSLDNEMIAIYQAAGLYIHGIGGYNFYNTYRSSRVDSNRKLWIDSAFMPDRASYRRNIGNRNRYRNNYFSGLAWGQGQLTATPLAIGRVAGAIANKGEMQPSKFLLNITYPDSQSAHAPVRLADPSYATTLAGFMTHLSASKEIEKLTGTPVSSKTGTPERAEYINGKLNKFNDAWYVFFAHSPKLNGPIVVCIRMEHLRTYSIAARELAKKIVVPVLQARQYLPRHQ